MAEPGLAWSQTAPITAAPPDGSVIPEVFLDARSTSFTRDGKQQVFEGDVVAIGLGVIITADRFEIDQAKKTVRAVGHVILLTDKSVFTGDEITYQLTGGDFEMLNGTMSAGDAQTANATIQKILGISDEEISFKADIEKRLAEIEAAKGHLRDALRMQARGKKVEPTPELVENYARLLEEQDLAKAQDPPSLARLEERRRDNYRKRREYWEKAKTQAAGYGTSISGKGYFKITGDTIERSDGNDYKAVDALWSPCECEPGSTPDWGFTAEKITAQMEGYANLEHAVLVIKGMPVLYLPFIKVPIKEKRQSGFLLPTFTWNTQSGNIFRQPIYFDHAPNIDSTLYTDVFEKRGTRLGLELRYQQRTYSGWNFHVEAMRDQLWLYQRGLRADLLDYYDQGMIAARKEYEVLQQNHQEPRRHFAAGEDATPPGKDSFRKRLTEADYWVNENGGELALCVKGTDQEREQCKRNVDSQLAVPSNTWRGLYSWRGQTFFAPRLSLVSHAEVVSDHRYDEDLHIPDDFADAFNTGKYAAMYHPARAQANLDGKDVYVGVRSAYGDNVWTDQQFKGQQLPADVVVQSRMFSLWPFNRGSIPVYGQMSAEHRQITEMTGLDSRSISASDSSLGNGTWDRAELNFVSPISPRSIVQVSHFADLETRLIEHAGLEGKQSSIQSWRTGLTFQLPIDGKAKLPTAWQPTDAEDIGARRYLHHIMNWAVTFATRPAVVRRGVYGDGDQKGSPAPVYFTSDRKVYDESDDAAPQEKTMTEFFGLIFDTTHTWHYLLEGWQATAENSAGLNQAQTKPETSVERAKRELLEGLVLPFRDSPISQALGPDGKPLYALKTIEHTTPVSLSGNISYNYLEEKKRREEKEQNAQFEEAAANEHDPAKSNDILKNVKQEDTLSHPWSDATGNIGVSGLGLSFTGSVGYSIYLKMARKATFGLGLPSFLDTSVGFGYTIEKIIDSSNGVDVNVYQQKTRSVGITTNLIPRINLRTDLAQRTKDLTDAPDQYETRFGAQYVAPSKCWGLSFTRVKVFDNTEEKAEYYLTLNVIFMGQQRPLQGDLFRPIRRQMPNPPEEQT